MFQQLGVIGCGLMGGSFALALKRAGLVKRVVGYSKSPSTTEKARKLGVIDTAAESALLAVAGSDIVLIAVPVAATEATFKAIKHLIEPGTLFMDVGSTKRDVVDAARRVLKEQVGNFVPAHPIAGKETAGIEHADAMLYAGRQVILTPLQQTRPELLQKATDTWAAIGCQVLKMSAENHDAAFAAVSHLPHLLAFALVHEVAGRKNSEQLFSFAAGGFRDFTRIASSHPEMWRDICAANKDQLLLELKNFMGKLEQVRGLLDDPAGLEKLFAEAREARDRWIRSS